MRRFLTFWRNLVRRDRLERDLDDEMRAVLGELVAEKIRGGMSAEEARRAAGAELGGVESVKTGVREIRADAFVHGLVQDARYALRLLRRNPIFTLTATLSLAVGIGATTTIFTVANGLLLRPAPGVEDPGGLVDIYEMEEGLISSPMTSYGVYLEVQRRATTVQGVFAYEPALRVLSLAGPDGAERVFGSLASPNYFEVLGVRAAAGRLFTSQDVERSGPLVVLSHRLWIGHYKSDPGVIGRSIRLNGSPFSIVGVAAPAFQGSTVTAPDVWIPAPFATTLDRRESAQFLQVMIGGRLKPGVRVSQTAAEMSVIGATLFGKSGGRGIDPNGIPMRRSANQGLSASASSPVPGSLRLAVAAFLTVLMTLVSLVLVIACANLAGVLLARASVRRREIAVRLAVGVGRARLVRQLLTETLLLFLLGGAAGLLVALLATTLVPLLLPAFPQPIALSLALDARVVAFALGVSLVAAVLSGLAPALQASRADVVTALKDTAQAPNERHRLRHGFVVAQVAFSMLLVLATGLFVERLRTVTVLDQGFDVTNVEQASFDLAMAGYTDATGPAFARELLARVRALPCVTQATLAEGVPAPGRVFGAFGDLTAPGVAPPAGLPGFSGNWHMVEPGYFGTIRMTLLAGRDFTEQDRAGGQQVAIVSRWTAQRLWPGEEAVGKTIVWRRQGPNERSSIDLVVVGVAPDLGRRDQVPPRGMVFLPVYVPMQQRYTPQITVLARSNGGRPMAGQIRGLVAGLDRNLPMLSAGSVEDAIIGPEQLQLRIAAVVSATVGLIGVFLAAIGVYGVTAYAVSRRTREIGVRLALGADRALVVGLVLRQGMTLVGIGSVVGLVLAAAAQRLLAGQLFGIAPLEWLTAAGTIVFFALVGLTACYVPTWRASRINALEALRYE
jgi:putative ABC transport system permease protein